MLLSKVVTDWDGSVSEVVRGVEGDKVDVDEDGVEDGYWEA